MRFGNFSARLRSAMDVRGLTQAQLAIGTGLTQATISRYLNGIQEPKSRELYAIARFLDVSMEALLTDDSPTKSTSAMEWQQRAMTAEQKLDALKSGLQAFLKKF